MRRLIFGLYYGGLLAVPTTLPGQQIPGRDLFEFPLGMVAEGSGLALLTGDGLRNPAAILLAPGVRGRISLSSLLTGTDQGVAAQVLSGAYSLQGNTVGLTVARASVNGIGRTESDPQTLGGDIPYTGAIVSLGAARRYSPRVLLGAALRVLHGEADATRRTAVGADAGIVIEHLPIADARLGASSFFWRPGSARQDGAAFNVAADARIVAFDSTQQLRAGYAFSASSGLSQEHFWSGLVRVAFLDARVGWARTTVYHQSTSRLRFALGVHYARYVVAVAREDAPNGLAPNYLFSLITTLPR